MSLGATVSVDVGSGAPQRAPQAAFDPGSSCSTAAGHCGRTGDHQGCTGPPTATEVQPRSRIPNLVYFTLHYTHKIAIFRKHRLCMILCSIGNIAEQKMLI